MKRNLEYVVYIGRFQPPHLAHIEIIKQALEMADKVIILVGSAMQPRTTKNPWTWRERETMIRAALPKEVSERVRLRPIIDTVYNDNKWIEQVQRTVAEATNGSDSVGIIGHTKDESSYYLQMFPQWGTPINVPNIEDMHATDIREAYFKQDAARSFDLAIGRNLPTQIHDYMKAFMLRDEYEQLVREKVFIDAYKAAWESAPFPPTFNTVDAVVIQSGHILLVRRKTEPGKGLWALPGGFLNQNETFRAAVVRELKEETKIKLPESLLHGKAKDQEPVVFDHPTRSLRGRTITHAFLFDLPAGPLPKVKGADDAEKAKWVPLSVFESMRDQMFEDHYDIVQYFT